MTLDLEAELKKAFEKSLSSHRTTTPPHLAQAMAYSLFAPGKRIRPRLTLECAHMLALDPRAALPAALALEMIHCFTLIHDDLPCMDDDDFRRGKPSNHRQFGEALALLAGDALIALALDVWTEAFAYASSPAAFIQAQRRLFWALGPKGVIGGQASETLLGDRSSIQDLEKMHALKTGALFEAAILIPRDLAGISPEEPRGQALEVFAHELGLAFQVADDLEDEEPEATSILFYMKRGEAQSRTLRRLADATAPVRKLWAGGADGLVAVSDEVSRLIQKEGS